jgi:putative phosphoesterase
MNMRIGILADSHGRVPVTAHAVRTLLDAGAEMLIHLGDVEREQVIETLAGHNARLVFGNCDWNTNALARCAVRQGVTVDDPIGRIKIGSRQITFTHGHLPHLMQQALADGTDYLLHGHTHQIRDERIGSTRVINPGALFRAPRYTVGVLEPETDTLEIIEVTKAPRRTAT